MSWIAKETFKKNEEKISFACWWWSVVWWCGGGRCEPGGFCELVGWSVYTLVKSTSFVSPEDTPSLSTPLIYFISSSYENIIIVISIDNKIKSVFIILLFFRREAKWPLRRPRQRPTKLSSLKRWEGEMILTAWKPEDDKFFFGFQFQMITWCLGPWEQHRLPGRRLWEGCRPLYRSHRARQVQPYIVLKQVWH